MSRGAADKVGPCNVEQVSWPVPSRERSLIAAIRLTYRNGTDIMSDDEFQDLKERLRDFAAERDWVQSNVHGSTNAAKGRDAGSGHSTNIQ